MKAKKLRKLLAISLLTIAGLFGVSSIVINKQLDENPIAEEAKADTTYNYIWYYLPNDWPDSSEFDMNSKDNYNPYYDLWINGSQDKNKNYFGIDYTSETRNTKSEVYGPRLAKIYYDPSTTTKIQFARSSNAWPSKDFSEWASLEGRNGQVYVISQYSYPTLSGGSYQVGSWISYESLLSNWLRPIYITISNGWNSSNLSDLWFYSSVDYDDASSNPQTRKTVMFQLNKRPILTFDGVNYVEVLIPKQTDYTSFNYFQLRAPSGKTSASGKYVVQEQYLASFSSYSAPCFTINTNEGSSTQRGAWSNLEFSITYKDKGDGAFTGTHGASYPTTYTYGVGATLDSPTKTNLLFAGYYSDSACTTPVTSFSTTDGGNKTVYARWQCKLDWQNDNGDDLGTTYVDEGDTPVYGGSTPTKESTATNFFEFNGWDPDISDPVTQNTTFTATYIAATSKMRVYIDNWGEDIFVGNGFGPANQPKAETSIAADKDKRIPASGTSVVATHDFVQDFAVPDNGQNNIAVTFFQGDTRWVPWRGSQRRDEGGLRNTVGLNDSFNENFSNGYIYSMHSFNGSDPHTNSYTDPYDAKYRECKWYTYSISRVGVFVHYDLNQGSHATLEATPDYEHVYNTNLTLASAPTRPGYTFMGWEDSITGLVNRAGSTYKNLTQPISLRAVWKSNTISVVPSDKIRIWVAYDYSDSIGIDSLLYSGLGNTCKLWLHDGESSGTTYSLLVEPSGIYYNTGENIHNTDLPNCPRRYDYFDIPRIYFDNGYYVTVQKFNDADVWQAQTSNAAHLSSTNNYSFKVLYLNCALDYGVKKWWFNSVDQGYGLAATDAMFAALGLAGMHTCDDDLMNGYGGYTNWSSTFLQTISASDLSAYTITDFCDGSSYASDTDINRSTNAYSKYLMIQANVSGGSRGFSLSNFLNGSHGEESQMSTIIIIVISSVSLLSLTALAILMVKKRKSQ